MVSVLSACEEVLFLSMVFFGTIEGGEYLKAVFPPLNLGLMRISRTRFKLIQNLSSHPMNLCVG